MQQSLVGGRFTIERAAGTGGMARVYRARDVTTNEVVALKLLHTLEAADLLRFDREIAALRGLHHPNIVRYVAHGTEPTSGEPYLAIEWLDGVDLQSRLAAGPLALHDTLALGRAIADALAIAHARGIVHRDIKPANVFLPGGDPAQAKVLDFGLARDAMATAALTRTGDILGTPLYMAPEQARGETDLDPRVDIHALGAVLFACVTGRPPFLANNLVGLLAKVAVDIPPRLRDVSPDVLDVPEALDHLVASMLAKRREERPAVASVRDALAAIATGGSLPAPAQPTSISVREQRVVCVLLAVAPVAWSTALDVTQDSRGSSSLRLADGTTLVTFTGPESPADLAVCAVRVALQMRGPEAALSLATGRAVLGAGAPVGEAIDRAARELASSRGVLRIDAATAGLVEGRFETTADERGALVHAERGAFDSLHTLLGKPTRCVGRDRDLAALEGFFAECEQERVARVVVVTADAGVGKSRLAREIAKRLGQREAAPAIVVARAESTLEGVPFALLADAIRRSAAFAREDDLAVRRAKLERLAGASGAELFGEILGVPSAAPSELLQAARESPNIFFEQLRRATSAWLRALASESGVAIVLEDLHWADPSSVTLLDVALRDLASAPVLVLALARPTVTTRWPALWASHQPHFVRLDPLSPRASERLVRQALGAVDDAVVQSIVERAAGNALFLEELVRAAGTGGVDEVPLGIVGTLQLRFDTLSPPARIALRAASVYGERFEAEAVAAIAPGLSIATALAELVTAELVRVSGEGFAFRHALVRDAAYTLLADEDRAIAHRLAAQYLEGHPTPNAAVIAHHFELGRDRARAAEWHERAAEHALALDDLVAARRHATAADELAAAPSGAMALLMAEIELFQSQLDRARTSALRALELLPEPSQPWFEAAGFGITSAGQLGDDDRVVELMARVGAHDPPPGAVSAFVQALARGCTQLLWGPRLEPARIAFARIEEVVGREPLTLAAEARLAHARSYLTYLDGAIDRSIALLDDASARYRRVGATRDQLQMDLLAGIFRGLAGLFEESERDLRAVVEGARAIDAHYLVDWAMFEVGMCHCFTGRRAEGIAIMDGLPPALINTPLFRIGRALSEGGEAFATRDREGLATTLARVTALGPVAPHYEPALAALRAGLALLDGDHESARREGWLAAELLCPDDFRGDYRAMALALSAATLAATAGEAGREHLSRVCDWIETIERRIQDPIVRHAHRHRVSWNRRTLVLAGRL